MLAIVQCFVYTLVLQSDPQKNMIKILLNIAKHFWTFKFHIKWFLNFTYFRCFIFHQKDLFKFFVGHSENRYKACPNIQHAATTIHNECVCPRHVTNTRDYKEAIFTKVCQLICMKRYCTVLYLYVIYKVSRFIFYTRQ